MNKFFLALLLFFFSFTGTIKGQDPHFSQYFSSPLTLNPAMAGFFKGDSRISTNFRQQWRSIGSPFITGTVSYDAKLLQTRIKDNDILAIGVLGLFDESLDGGFKSTNLSASVTYHKALDADDIHHIGVGFQFMYATRTLNFNSLDFANQFNGSGFDTNIPSNEAFGTSRRNYVDINTGILYNYKTENTELYLGGSLYHAGRPNTSFLKNQEFRLPMRYTVHAGSRFVLGGNSNEFFIGGLYMNQAGASDKIIGIAYGLNMNDDAMIYAGSWYRISDAIIPFIGLSYHGFHVGLSYDITNSSLKNYSSKNGSFELSMNLLVTKPRNVYTNYKGEGYSKGMILSLPKNTSDFHRRKDSIYQHSTNKTQVLVVAKI
jgi:type IX secretion system PorP/SprF family membrane protein